MLKYSARDFSCIMIFKAMLSLCLFLIIIWQLTAHIYFFNVLCVPWFVYFVAIYSRVSHKAVGAGNVFFFKSTNILTAIS